MSWIQLSNANVASLEGNVLTLEFARDGELKGFSASGSDAILARVLRERFGVDWHVRAVPAAGRGRLETSGLVPGGHDKVTAQVNTHGTGQPAAGRGRAPRIGLAANLTARWIPLPQQADPAVGREAARADPARGWTSPIWLTRPTSTMHADAGLTGMELITRELGGQVIGEIDDSGGFGRPSPR